MDMRNYFETNLIISLYRSYLEAYCSRFLTHQQPIRDDAERDPGEANEEKVSHFDPFKLILSAIIRVFQILNFSYLI